MRKSTRIVKKYIAAFLIVLMSIENFAAVVGDNDGAAFITKAEFDSLKNNFQAQIDQYNTSIDSKIDGAIASYLAGLSISKQATVKPEFSGYTVLAMNLDKIDKLKFGKMDFDISASTMNLTWNYLDMTGRKDGSSGACALKMSRKSDGHGEGFEVFRVDKNNQLKYSNDLRFHFTASRTEHSIRGLAVLLLRMLFGVGGMRRGIPHCMKLPILIRSIIQIIIIDGNFVLI